MTRQIAVRLPEDLVEFIDRMVEAGQASSRAEVVARAVQRERRRQVAGRDAAILAGAAPDREFDPLSGFAASTPLDDID
jgi:Arc/MetJ-type ribon-helix-helix transcriptional regulator